MLLQQEIKKLIPGAKVISGSPSGLVRFSVSENAPSFAVNPVDRTLATLALNSRVATGVMFELSQPFRSEWENQLRERLREVPWGVCYKKGSQLPNISVRTTRSRLTEPGYVTRLVRESLTEYLGASPAVAGNSEPEGIVPSLAVHIEDDVLRLYVDAGGINMSRMQLESFPSQSRLDVSEPIASGCVIRSFRKVFEKSTSPTTIWDPFSGSGTFPLMAAKTIAGVPPGSPSAPNPFRLYACHDSRTFDSVVDDLRLDQYSNAALVEQVLISDSSVEGIRVAERNLTTFENSLPLIGGHSVVPFPIQVERKPDAYIPPTSNHLAILTALPAGDDTERRFRKFDSMLDQIEGKLVGCVVLTSKPGEFKRISKRKWLTELRVFDGRRFIESLNLVQ